MMDGIEERANQLHMDFEKVLGQYKAKLILADDVRDILDAVTWLKDRVTRLCKKWAI